MRRIQLTSCQLLIAGAVACVSMPLFANHEDDLLDPSLDQPLPQYERTGGAGFREGPTDTKQPATKESTVATPKPVPLRSFNTGSELAVNPLSTLLGQESQRKVQALETPDSAMSDLPAMEAPARSQPSPTASVKPNRISNPPKEEAAPLTDVRTQSAPPKAKPEPTQQLRLKKKATAEPAAAKKKKSAVQKPVLNFDIYRDASQYPIDPRKANNPCTQGANCGCGCRLSKKYGVNGRPYQPRELGGYTCGAKCPNKRPQFSAYWPRPLSAKLDERNPQRAAARYSGCQEKKLVDVFDRLTNFRLIDYQRTDSGYCGPESDPYGCLGESKHFGSVHQIPASMEPYGFGY